MISFRAIIIQTINEKGRKILRRTIDKKFRFLSNKHSEITKLNLKIRNMSFSLIIVKR